MNVRYSERMPRKRQSKEPFKIPYPIDVQVDDQEQPVKVRLLEGDWTDVVVCPVLNEIWQLDGRIQATKTWCQATSETGPLVIFKNLHTGQWWHARDRTTRPPDWPLGF